MGLPSLRRAVIVAHGSPSEPEPLDRSVKALAAEVARSTPGDVEVAGVTLAMPGSLEDALRATPHGGPVLIYPYFMSLGWFVKKQLRKRVSQACAPEIPVSYLTPFGLDASIPDLCVTVAASAVREAGHDPARATLVLAAHGSRTGHAAARAARAVATRIRWRETFAEVRVGFVEESPSIMEAASNLAGRPSVCLPLFATTAGHVSIDVPEGLAAAGFDGLTLPPIGENAAVASLIATALATAAKTAKAPREAACEAVR